MAKMFYSLDEAAQRLGKSVAEVQEMVDSGQLQEFRDRDKIVLKRDQVELLAGDAGAGDDLGTIPLADSQGGSSLALSLEDSGPISLEPEPSKSSPGARSGVGLSGSGAGSGMGIEVDEPAKERSGINIFDDVTEEGDPSAVTQITEGAAAAGAPEFNLETVGSGSGLLDLTREGDDTSLGADLLEDVYKGDEDGAAAGAGAGGGDSGGALFESTSAASDVSAAAGIAAGAAGGLVLAEPYDGKASGWTGGLALGGALVAALSLAAVVLSLLEVGNNPIVGLFASNFFMWMGIAAGVVVLCGIVGFLLGRKS
jgi:hypothetical protein